MLKPRVATMLFGFSSSPAITSLKGSATISLVKMYFLLRGLIFSSIFDLKSTGNFSRPIFKIILEAVSSNLSDTLHTSEI